jgi:hypothetical protein
LFEEGPIRRLIRERRERLKTEVIGEKRFYYCDNPRHPHGEIVQVLTYERDPKCPICLKVMTYGKYWR